MTLSRKPSKRVFVDAPLDTQRLNLDQELAHYLGRVLRCRESDEIVVFNARGTERLARIESLGRSHPSVSLGERLDPLPEPEVPLFLLQALVKSDAMDLIVQKATELGAHSVLATRTEFSVVRLDANRKPKRLAHWRRIAASACEQSGRHRPPDVEIFDSLSAATAALPADCARIAFVPGAATAPAAVSAGSICLAVGPEGGFSDSETSWLESAGFTLCSLGPRILRADTAAIAVLTCAQLLNGDLR
jgi:16S rRNA (uracil1498-N3)-methyltransferase